MGTRLVAVPRPMRAVRPIELIWGVNGHARLAGDPGIGCFNEHMLPVMLEIK